MTTLNNMDIEQALGLDRAAEYRRIWHEEFRRIEAKLVPKGAGGQYSGQQRAYVRSATQKAALGRLSRSSQLTGRVI